MLTQYQTYTPRLCCRQRGCEIISAIQKEESTAKEPSVLEGAVRTPGCMAITAVRQCRYERHAHSEEAVLRFGVSLKIWDTHYVQYC